MNNQKTIDTIEMAMYEVEWEYPLQYYVAFQRAIEALKELDERYMWHEVSDKVYPEMDSNVIIQLPDGEYRYEKVNCATFKPCYIVHNEDGTMKHAAPVRWKYIV